MIPPMRRTTALGAGALVLGALVAAGLAMRRARLEPMLVKGGSMRPTLGPGQRIAVAGTWWWCAGPDPPGHPLGRTP
jgi:signal peptidase I